jgi:LysM repeat protein
MNMDKILAVGVLLCCLAFAVDGYAAKKHRTHTIKKGDTPGLVAKKYRISTDELFRYNSLKPDEPLRVGRKLLIPFPGEVTGKRYKVKSGDSVARIADFHGVSQNDLRAANGLRAGNFVRVGQTLVIPHVLRGDAARSHVVRRGDTLASIAKRHRVSVKNLAAANKLHDAKRLKLGRTLIIPDKEDDVDRVYKRKQTRSLVKSGRVVKGGVRHTIQPGQSLWIIARAYNVKGDQIAKVNGFKTDDPLSVGKEIFIPGAREVVPVRVKGFVIQSVRFVRVWNDKTATLKLMTNSGRINKRSREILSKLAGPKRRPRRTRLLHPRLLHMLQRVAERYPGQRIEIISGVRPRKKGQELSKHNVGRALDFRVQGIPRKELYHFVKQLPKTGAGYYPNSVFIHMDVRDRKANWTDMSGPGERAQYLKRGQKWSPDSEASALENEETRIIESAAETKALDADAKAVEEE